MPLILFKTIPPYHQVAVNPDEILVIMPEPHTPYDDCELLGDDNRNILVLENVDAAAAKLGANFVRFSAALPNIPSVYVNRLHVMHATPHAHVPNVTLIQVKGRSVAVRDSLADVVRMLEA